jgi:biotin carboxylase
VPKKVFAIVDGYSTGNCYAPLLRGYGYKCIHISSSSSLEKYYLKTFCENDYIDRIQWNEGQSAENQLKKYSIIAFICGSEPGVVLTEKLNQQFQTCLSNPQFDFNIRQNKYRMGEELKRRGCPSMLQFQLEELGQFSKILDSKEVKFPLVIKPTFGAGTYGVKICENREESLSHIGSIFDRSNFFGYADRSVLIQEYLRGQEYCVNTVSKDGRHFVSEILKVNKNQNHGYFLYDFSQTVHSSNHEYEKLVAYNDNVLNCLNFKNGACHNEIMLTDRGPILIESNGRITGGIDPTAYVAAHGHYQGSMHVESVLSPETFKEKSYKLLPRTLRVVFLTSNILGEIKNDPDIAEIENLPSFHSARIATKGDFLQKTKDFLSSPGYINLVHHDESFLQKDYETIRSLESGIYTKMIGTPQ